ncbi:MAG: hypothetical protein A2V66_15530 [Ignavibacteria bacterium RBG_13_36_8]|nr:MAG: hypothetical protein A2V66_15530 [Ignavibacteria bacterium RBG_13_36_8]
MKIYAKTEDINNLVTEFNSLFEQELNMTQLATYHNKYQYCDNLETETRLKSEELFTDDELCLESFSILKQFLETLLIEFNKLIKDIYSSSVSSLEEKINSRDESDIISVSIETEKGINDKLANLLMCSIDREEDDSFASKSDFDDSEYIDEIKTEFKKLRIAKDFDLEFDHISSDSSDHAFYYDMYFKLVKKSEIVDQVIYVSQSVKKQLFKLKESSLNSFNDVILKLLNK